MQVENPPAIQLCLLLSANLSICAESSHNCAAKEAKAHDLAGDNPKDFDPFKDAERAAQKAAALAAATVNNLNLKDVSSKVSTPW